MNDVKNSEIFTAAAEVVHDAPPPNPENGEVFSCNAVYHEARSQGRALSDCIDLKNQYAEFMLSIDGADAVQELWAMPPVRRKNMRVMLLLMMAAVEWHAETLEHA